MWDTTTHLVCVGYPLILSVCRTPPRAKSVNAFRDYHIAFHGTRAGCLLGVLDSGTLLVPGMLEWALVHVALFMPKGALCVCGYWHWLISGSLTAVCNQILQYMSLPRMRYICALAHTSKCRYIICKLCIRMTYYVQLSVCACTHVCKHACVS